MIRIIVNGEELQAEENKTILQVAEDLGIQIPTLCNFSLGNTTMNCVPGSCRVCLVEIAGQERLLPACSTRVLPNMDIRTHSLAAIRARRAMVELLLSDHPKDCLICPKNGDCELQALAVELDIREIRYPGTRRESEVDVSSNAISRDLGKCILCRKCVEVCNQVQTVGVLSPVKRGFHSVVAPAFMKPLSETECTFCGQCVAVCPTGALTEVSQVNSVWEELDNPDTFVVVQTAPAVRVALGEEFGMQPGLDVTGKMVAALRRIGFDRVLDTNFAADLTIMEEGAELMHRITNEGTLPMLTSCCPGWVSFIENQFPDLLDVPSTCKSPQQMFGAVIKSYYSEKLGIAPERLRVVSVMPCLAKKHEAERPELNSSLGKDVDYVLSTREIAAMIRESGISFSQLQDGEFDHPLGESTGAAAIFGTSGGVMEAALRTVADLLTGQELSDLEYRSVRGMQGIKEADVTIGDLTFKVAVASGLGNARLLLEGIRSGTSRYLAIEIMACPGGCIDGGGQPYIHGDVSILQKRMEAIYVIDRGKALRKSHQNPEILRLYSEYLGEPYTGERSHHLLHTTYSPGKYFTTHSGAEDRCRG